MIWRANWPGVSDPELKRKIGKEFVEGFAESPNSLRKMVGTRNNLS